MPQQYQKQKNKMKNIAFQKELEEKLGKLVEFSRLDFDDYYDFVDNFTETLTRVLVKKFHHPKKDKIVCYSVALMDAADQLNVLSEKISN